MVQQEEKPRAIHEICLIKITIHLIKIDNRTIKPTDFQHQY